MLKLATYKIYLQTHFGVLLHVENRSTSTQISLVYWVQLTAVHISCLLWLGVEQAPKHCLNQKSYTNGFTQDTVCIIANGIMMTSSNGNLFRVTGHLCGEFTGPGEFPAQRPVTRSSDVFFDLRLNKLLSKQSWGWWFETLGLLSVWTIFPSRFFYSILRLCNHPCTQKK